MRGPYGAVDIGFRRFGHPRPHLARRRVGAFERAPVGGIHPFPVNEHLVAAYLGHASVSVLLVIPIVERCAPVICE